MREFFPAALTAFEDLAAPDTPHLLGRAPDPARAARLSVAQISVALRRANRRDIPVKAARIQQLLQASQLRQPPAVQLAYAAIVIAQVQLIGTLNTEIDRLGQAVTTHFGHHRQAEHYLSLPGIGTILGARLLGEFGDDPTRFLDAKARRHLPDRPRLRHPPRGAGSLRPQPPTRRRRAAMGLLHGCLKTNTIYDEATAWAHHQAAA